MRLRHSIMTVAAAFAVLAPAVKGQMPAKPNAVRTQVTQGTTARPAAPVQRGTQVPPAPGAQAPAPAAPAAPAPAPTGPRRDPFNPLLGNSTGGGAPSPDRLPPGKAGLMVGTVRVDGLVRGPNGMIGVVSNPQQRVYFLREGDRIFDGRVVRITMEAITFQQTGRDAFGNSLEREVTRRLYPNPGEQR